MAIDNGYCTLAELKSWLNEIGDTNDDAELELAVEAASRKIDAATGRRFWKDSSDDTRVFTAESGSYLRVPDIVSITSLKTDDNNDRTYEITWATDDYDTEPADGIIGGVDGWPILELVARTDSSSGQRTFPTHARGVQIVGKFGWNAVPDPIKEATLILASRLFKRREAPFGQSGTPEFGVANLPRLDPDVRALVTPFSRMHVGAV